jgi:hypothetical protein
MEILSKSFSTLDKDPDERYSECQKVEKLLGNGCKMRYGMGVSQYRSGILACW